jgi:8-oxo-(d)GTP phosphatase
VNTEVDPPAPEVRAAGGVVLRAGANGTPEVLVVHRPSYDDWSLPKGKLDPGESWHEAAVREVWEETGVTARLGVELTSTHYRDRNGRTKQVRWWTMPMLRDDHREPDGEVDEQRWVPADEAGALLSYDDDRRLIRQALEAIDHVTVLVVRHAHAGQRGKGPDDDRLRGLSTRGRRQAEGLVALFAPWHVTRLVSSPLTRCVETLEPLARATDLELVLDERLAEGASPAAVRALVASADSGTVVCTHGDLVSALVAELAHGGVVHAGERRWAKGSTWAIQHDGDGRFAAASYLPPA